MSHSYVDNKNGCIGSDDEMSDDDTEMIWERISCGSIDNSVNNSDFEDEALEEHVSLSEKNEDEDRFLFYALNTANPLYKLHRQILLESTPANSYFRNKIQKYIS